MTQTSFAHVVAVAVASMMVSGCGGGDNPAAIDPSIASVVITSAPPAFGAIGRSVPLAAEARDSAGAALPGHAFSWTSSNPAAASVSSSGVVTAVANGTTQVTAATSGKTSAGLTVTVSQVPHQLTAAPTSVTFGAIGSTRQLAATVQDSTGNAVAGAAVTWSRAGAGTTATVSAAGLVTATGNGALQDTAVATAGSVAARVPITVAQVAATVTVTSAAGVTPDTLYTTGRTRQFTAAAADSNGNAIAAAGFTWSSTTTAVASVNASSGVATAVADGTTQIRATSGTVNGSRALVVRRYASTFTLSPGSAAIATAFGTQVFAASAQDSLGNALPIAWVTRPIGVASVSPAAGTSTTATAVANGSTFVVMSGGTRSDSAALTASNQPATVSFAGDVQPIFTANCAVAGCHTGANPTGGMNLSAGQARGQIVNQAALGFPGATRVIPGDAENSYLIRKLENRSINGAQMPDGRAPLGAATIQVIRNWINQGAANN